MLAHERDPFPTSMASTGGRGWGEEEEKGQDGRVVRCGSCQRSKYIWCTLSLGHDPRIADADVGAGVGVAAVVGNLHVAVVGA